MNASPIVGIGTVLSVGDIQAEVVDISATENIDRLGNRLVIPWVTLDMGGYLETFSASTFENEI